MFPAFLNCGFPTRRFCSRLLSRDSVQLRVWEMDEMDEEALAYWDGVAGGPRPPPHPHSSPSSSASSGSDPSSSEDETGKDTRKRSAAGGAVAPFAGHRIAPFLFPRATARTRNGYRRPPVFGPEKVVMDARVLAAHKAVLAETMRFGVFCLLVRRASRSVAVCVFIAERRFGLCVARCRFGLRLC